MGRKQALPFGCLRRFEFLVQSDRQHRQNHTARVVAGLVSCRLRLRFSYAA